MYDLMMLGMRVLMTVVITPEAFSVAICFLQTSRRWAPVMSFVYSISYNMR